MNPLIIASAFGSILGGIAAEDESKMAAFDTETQRTEGEALALQQAAVRREEYDRATEANVAMFYASGRDVGSDRSVEAFLTKQKEIVGKDLGRISEQSAAESRARNIEAMSLRRRGANARRASLFQAIGTIGQGIEDAKKTSIPIG